VVGSFPGPYACRSYVHQAAFLSTDNPIVRMPILCMSFPLFYNLLLGIERYAWFMIYKMCLVIKFGIRSGIS
jgi:hypothetical protein